MCFLLHIFPKMCIYTPPVIHLDKVVWEFMKVVSLEILYYLSIGIRRHLEQGLAHQGVINWGRVFPFYQYHLGCILDMKYTPVYWLARSDSRGWTTVASSQDRFMVAQFFCWGGNFFCMLPVVGNFAWSLSFAWRACLPRFFLHGMHLESGVRPPWSPPRAPRVRPPWSPARAPQMRPPWSPTWAPCMRPPWSSAPTRPALVAPLPPHPCTWASKEDMNCSGNEQARKRPGVRVRVKMGEKIGSHASAINTSRRD